MFGVSTITSVKKNNSRITLFFVITFRDAYRERNILEFQFGRIFDVLCICAYHKTGK